MLEERIAKAEFELMDAGEFDRIIVNDDLQLATAELLRTVAGFITAGARRGSIA